MAQAIVHEALLQRASRRRGRAATLLTGALAVGAALPAFAQTQLQLPQTHERFIELIRESEQGPCGKCGVVLSVRAAPLRNDAGAPARQQAQPGAAAAAGPGEAVATTPVVGRAARDYRKELKTPPASGYVVGIRYDDGSYGTVEQDEEPRVRKGDRVRLSQGVLERAP